MGAELGGGQAEARCRHGMVDKEISVDGLVEGPSTDKDHRLSPIRAAQPGSMCEKIWTLPMEERTQALHPLGEGDIPSSGPTSRLPPVKVAKKGEQMRLCRVPEVD